MKSYIPTAIALACVFALVLVYFCIQMESARNTIQQHEGAHKAQPAGGSP
jgi:hypothetical protein